MSKFDITEATIQALQNSKLEESTISDMYSSLDDQIKEEPIDTTNVSGLIDDVLIITDPQVSSEEYDEVIERAKEIVEDTPEGEIPFDESFIGQYAITCPICGATFVSSDILEPGATCPVCLEIPEAFVVKGKLETDEKIAEQYKDTLSTEEELIEEPQEELETEEDVETEEEQLAASEEVHSADNKLEESKDVETEEFEVSELKRKAQEILPKEDIDTHDSDLYIRVSDKATELLSHMKDNNSGLLRKFKSQIDEDMWYEIPFANMEDDAKNKLNEVDKNIETKIVKLSDEVQAEIEYDVDDNSIRKIWYTDDNGSVDFLYNEEEDKFTAFPNGNFLSEEEENLIKSEINNIISKNSEIKTETTNNQLKTMKDKLFAGTQNRNRSEWTDEEKTLYNEIRAIEMIHSILTYTNEYNWTTNYILNNKYMKSYIEELGEEKVRNLAEQEILEYKSATINKDVYTDSEGVSYNSVTFKDESKQVESLEQNDEEGWGEDIAEILEPCFEQVEKVAYEVRNGRRGSYAGFGDTVSDLVSAIDEIREMFEQAASELEDMKEQLQESNIREITDAEKKILDAAQTSNSKYTLDNIKVRTTPEGNLNIRTADDLDICTIDRLSDEDMEDLRLNGYFFNDLDECDKKEESVTVKSMIDWHNGIEDAESMEEIQDIIYSIDDNNLELEVQKAYDQCVIDEDDLEAAKDFIIATLEDNAQYED